MSPHQEPKETATTDRGSLRGRVIAAVCVLIALIVGVAGGLYLQEVRHAKITASPSASPSLSIKITAFGVSSTDGEVTIHSDGGGFNISGPEFSDGSSPSDQEENEAVIQGLAILDNLRAWHFCAAELQAASTVSRARANAVLQYPRNMPHNREPSYKDVEYLTRQYRLMAAFDKAAVVAAQNNLACVNGPVTTKIHQIDVKIESGGAQKTLTIGDYHILDPVEMYTLLGLCAEEYTQQLERLKQTPVDTVEKGIDTLSEQGKFTKVAHYEAEISLMNYAGLKTC